MRMSIHCLAVAAVAIFITSCGPTSGEHTGGADLNQRYRTAGTVLESDEHGPELCFGIAESNPPQCGGIPITNWDWDRVGSAERNERTIWGEYELVGTFDGSSFRVVEARPTKLPDASPEDDFFKTPCPEPPGGWRPVDATRLREKHLSEAMTLAHSSPDFAGEWIDYIGEPPYVEPVVKDHIIWNVAFTGDLAKHERELREKWGGALCVIKHERTERELNRIQDELVDGGAEDLGLWLFGAAVSTQENVVFINVAVSDGRTQEQLDARYGEGAVRVFPYLRPVA